MQSLTEDVGDSEKKVYSMGIQVRKLKEDFEKHLTAYTKDGKKSAKAMKSMDDELTEKLKKL